jgi:hypothetical protein
LSPRLLHTNGQRIRPRSRPRSRPRTKTKTKTILVASSVAREPTEPNHAQSNSSKRRRSLVSANLNCCTWTFPVGCIGRSSSSAHAHTPAFFPPLHQIGSSHWTRPTIQEIQTAGWHPHTPLIHVEEPIPLCPCAPPSGSRQQHLLCTYLLPRYPTTIVTLPNRHVEETCGFCESDG